MALTTTVLGLVVASQPQAGFLYGLTADGLRLLHFDSAAPQVIMRGVAITGLQPGERLAGIDLRPATSELFGIGIVTGATDTARLYRIDPLTGVATAVGGPFATDLTPAAAYGLDFDPVRDALRVVNVAGENLRVDPLTGTATRESTLTTPNITAVAYDHNVGGVLLTTLFGIDTGTSQLVRIGGVSGTPSPDGGAVNAIGPLAVDVENHAAFDIDASSIPFAALTIAGQTSLYTIDLNNGAATMVGAIGDGTLALAGLTAATSTVSVTISPPSGSYGTTQRFDLQLFVQTGGRAFKRGSVMVDGIDVTPLFASCLVVGTQLPAGGVTLRCPGVSGEQLGPGPHVVVVTVVFAGAPTPPHTTTDVSATASVVWTVVRTVEP